MLPFQLPGFVAFGVQFDGLFQIFEGAILVSFQVLDTAPFGVCFAEIGFQINRFVEESNGFIQTFLRDQELEMCIRDRFSGTGDFLPFCCLLQIYYFCRYLLLY